MIYLDASVLVAALTSEPHSDRARTWLRQHASSQFADSWWTGVEVASALAMKERRGVLSADERGEVEGRWLTLREKSLHHLPVEHRHHVAAAMLVDALPAGLRAGDALHLAVVLDHGCELATYDRDLAAAALERGVSVHGLDAVH